MNQLLRHGFAVLATVLGSSCAHVQLEVPGREATSEVRREAWERLRPAETYAVVDSHRWGHRHLWTHSLTLGDGREIHDPSDLLPAVAPNSRTALYVARFQERRRKWNVWGGIAGSAFGLITVPLFVSVGQALGRGGPSYSVNTPASSAAGIAFWTLYLTALVVPIVSVVVGAITVGNANSDRDRAFDSYPADLHRFLFRPDEAAAPALPP